MGFAIRSSWFQLFCWYFYNLREVTQLWLKFTPHVTDEWNDPYLIYTLSINMLLHFNTIIVQDKKKLALSALFILSSPHKLSYKATQ